MDYLLAALVYMLSFAGFYALAVWLSPRYHYSGSVPSPPTMVLTPQQTPPVSTVMPESASPDFTAAPSIAVADIPATLDEPAPGALMAPQACTQAVGILKSQGMETEAYDLEQEIQAINVQDIMTLHTTVDNR